MRAFRFSLFLASMAGALSAAAYLWTPLVSPKAPQLHLAAPSLRSSVLEPPLRIPPLALHVAAVRHVLPVHVVGNALVRLPHVAPPVPQVVVRRVAPVTPAPAPAPAVVHRSAAPAAPKLTPSVGLPVPSVHVTPAAPEPTPAVKPATPPPVVVVPAPAPAPAPVAVTPSVVTSAPPAEAAPAAQPVTNAPATPAPAPTPAPVSTPPPSTVPPPTTPGPTATPTPTPTPTPPPVVDDSRGGWGCGDKNHDHSGPGNGQASPCNK